MMQEYLNDYEREMLVYFGDFYHQYYELEMELPPHDFEVFDGRAVDKTQNIISALKERGYITYGPYFIETGSQVRDVYFTEKALNLFNSPMFDEMKKVL